MRVQTGGGAATQAGTDYENRVAAWVAVQILAEQEATSSWGLPDSVFLNSVQFQTNYYVDDLLVVTSDGGRVFIQAKHSISFSTNPNSQFASTLRQFVRHFIDLRGTLDLSKDRIVLTTTSHSSRPIRQLLFEILKRTKNLASNQDLIGISRNAAEREVLEKLNNQIRNLWSENTPSLPSENDILDFLRIFDVQILDIDRGEMSEREALNSLRSSILRDPNQSDNAWDTLITSCAELAITRGMADRQVFQNNLGRHGIPPKATPSYRDDITRLTRHSQLTLEALFQLSKINVGGQEVKVKRESTDILKEAINSGSVVVVGEPGAGKSGALYDLGERLCNEGRSFIFFATDMLEARSLGELRNEIGLEHDILEVLNNWPQETPGVLIIDALDAARSDSSAHTFRELIDKVINSENHENQWLAVVSIRKYDLRYNRKLQNLFLGQTVNTKYQDREFSHLRHLNVPGFGEDEITQIQNQSQELSKLINNANPDFRELLKIPFNLRLAAELIDAKTILTSIRNQIGLLDTYWEERVIRNDNQGDARESVLRLAVMEMLRTRSLKTERTVVSRDPSNSRPLSELLSSNLLKEWQPAPEGRPNRYILAFSHNRLFDYAVECLFLRGPEDSFIKKIEEDPELVMAARPSIDLHFQHLWFGMDESGRDSFWAELFKILESSKIPEIGKIIGPSVAAEVGKNISEFNYLLEYLQDDTGKKGLAEDAFKHLVGAIVVKAEYSSSMVGKEAPPWCELLERCSGPQMSLKVAIYIRQLLREICERHKKNLKVDLTTEQFEMIGKASRNLLSFVWTGEPYNSWFATQGIQCVSVTFESDPKKSAALLRLGISADHLAQHGYEELFWLADGIKSLIPLDPELVEDIYIAAFSYHEESEDKTPMGSRLVPLVSNRKQDYEGALFSLIKTYPEFLRQASHYATEVLVVAIDEYVNTHQKKDFDEIEEAQFLFNNTEAKICSDYSSIWDTGRTYSYEKPLEMLDVFENYLKKIGVDIGKRDQWIQLIDILIQKNRHAVIWRRLLEWGKEFPGTIGKYLSPLAQAKPILTFYDTTREAGSFIRSIFPFLTNQERKDVERTIISIPYLTSDDENESYKEIRNRLLGCLPRNLVMTDTSKALLREMDMHKGPPSNISRLPTYSTFVRDGGEKDFLRYRGVPVDEPQNQHILDLEEPVKSFINRQRNSNPTRKDIEEIIQFIQALQKALEHAGKEGVSEEIKDSGWGCLAEAYSLIAKSKEFDCAKFDWASNTKKMLLDLSTYRDPRPNPTYDAQFDDHASWGSPAARIDAAKGLMWIASKESCIDKSVLEAIKRLGRDDEVPAVRYQVSSSLRFLYHSDQNSMWEIIEDIAKKEPSRGVLQGLIHFTLQPIAGQHADRITKITNVIFKRITDGKGVKEVRTMCTSIFTGLFIWQDNEMCQRKINEITLNPERFNDEAHRIVDEVRDTLNLNLCESKWPNQDEIQSRSFSLLGKILENVKKNITSLPFKKEYQNWIDEEKKKLELYSKLADSIASQIYYASGALKGDKEDDDSRVPKTTEERELFLRNAEPILDGLSELGYIPSLVHHLIETLEYLMDANPQGVFEKIGKVIQSGKECGYQYESMAADVIVRVAQRFLAEYRYILQESSASRKALVEILDTFVDAGWPEARKLVFRLDEIYR